MSTDFPQFLIWLAGFSSVAVVLVWLVTNVFRQMSAAWKNLLWRLAIVTPLVVLPILLSDLRLNIPVKQAQEKQAALLPVEPSIPLVEKRGEGTPVLKSSSPKISSRIIVLGVWLSGALAMAWLFVFQHARLRRDFRFARKAELSPDESQAMSLTMVDAVTHPAVRVPFCCGILRPLIVLPADFSKLSRSERWICLVHELTHLRRGDLAWLALAQLSCAISWFNPLMWFALGRLKYTAELATDDAILSEKTSPTSYAQTLLAVSELAGSGRTPTGALAMARAGSLKLRLASILDPATRRGVPGRPMSAVLVLAYLGVMGLASSVRTVEAAQQPSPPSLQPPSSPPSQEVSVDQLASFLNVSVWKSRVALPFGKFSATILRVENGKITEYITTYLPPYPQRDEAAPEPRLTIFSAPAGETTKVRLGLEWKTDKSSGAISTGGTFFPRGTASHGSFHCSLPETIGVGDYVLGGEAPSDKVNELNRMESYVDGLVLRIRKTNGQVAIHVKKNDSLELDGKIISLDELVALLDGLHESDPAQQVAILSEKGRDDYLAIKVRDICKAAGITDILF